MTAIGPQVLGIIQLHLHAYRLHCSLESAATNSRFAIMQTGWQGASTILTLNACIVLLVSAAVSPWHTHAENPG